jgi:PAS domain S-box-containing protein
MSQQQRTLLIVDDSPEDRELYRRYLRRDREYSYTIFEATLGQQGLELWQQHQPDVILLDYRLPDIDGLEFLAQLQPLSQGICLPVIVVTGQGNEAIAVKAMKAGAQDYIVKEQITPEGLQIAVNGAIETVRLRTQLQQRIERERVVSYITQKIHQSLSLDEILQTTVTEVQEFLHTDRVLVFKLKPDGDGTVIAESVGAHWRSLLSSTMYDPCLAENYLAWNSSENVTYDPAFVENYIQRYRQGYVTAIFDIQDSTIDPCHVELLAQFQVKANLVVPIIYDNYFWGLLIAHNCATPRRWQPLEIDLLKDLAIQVGIAIRQAELYQQAENELTERRRIEAELRQSEERLRLALSASRMGTWNWNIQTGKITWSDNLEALFGLQPGEFDGSFEMFVARLHPDDRDRVLAAVDRAVATREDYDIEFRVVYPNGTIRWTLSQGKVFYDQQGQPMQMAGVDIDITERKRSAETLRQSEERFRQLAENIDAVFWIRDVSENRVSYVSPAYQRLWGFNPQELYQGQQAWIDRIHPEDRKFIERAFHEKAAAGKFDEEYRIILPDGTLRWVRDRCFPLRDETGEIYRFAGIAEDISNRKHSLVVLQESEERFRTSVENMLDCLAYTVLYEMSRDKLLIL